jgi:diguanylate cyclase
LGHQSTFSEDLQAAKKLAAAANEAMSKHGIAPSPANYCVWYAYVGKSIAALNREIDERLALQKGFGWQVNQELFDKYFGTDAESMTIRRSGAELHDTMGRVLKRLDTAGQDVTAFGETLVEANGSLARVASVEAGVQAVVKRLSGATNDMVRKNRDLEQELRQSTEQIATLQDRLEQARREAFTDALTGIGNRRCFDLALGEKCERATLGEIELSLLLLDIDHFKRFNDTYGHRIGDQVLKIVAAKMKQMSRDIDTPARYGGEEFALLLVNAPFDTALRRADQLREALASNYLRNVASGDNYGQITVSIGVSRFRATAATASSPKRLRSPPVDPESGSASRPRADSGAPAVRPAHRLRR